MVCNDNLVFVHSLNLAVWVLSFYLLDSYGFQVEFIINILHMKSCLFPMKKEKSGDVMNAAYFIVCAHLLLAGNKETAADAML